MLREDLTMNPIPGRADQMRAQAAREGGLCAIEIPGYTDTDGFLDTIVSSVTGDSCNFNVCGAAGCRACLEEGSQVKCVLCNATNDCDGLENVVEYRCDVCDAVVTLNENNEFAMYTVSYKANDTPNDIKLIGIFDALIEEETLEVYDHYGFAINSPIHPTVIPGFSESTSHLYQQYDKVAVAGT